MAKSMIYRGNTINNFGRNLPVPYVERIELYNVTDEEELAGVAELVGLDGLLGGMPISKITVVTSILFTSSEEFLLTDFTNELFDDLTINFMVLTDTDLISSLKESKKNLKDVIASLPSGTGADWKTTRLVNLNNQIRSVPLSTYLTDIGDGPNIAFTSEYDEFNNEILKSSNITYDLYIPAISSLDDITIFAGVSVGDPSELIQFQNVAMALSFGDLAVEPVKSAGNLNSRDSIGFFDSAGAYYPDQPMMDLKAHYRAADAFDQEDIKEAVDSLIAQYAHDAEKDQELETVLDNIDYIYNEYGETPMYLVQLNRYRRNIKNQDQTTPAGKFYERYRRLVVNAGTALSSYPELTKRITYSSKIRDYRPSQWMGLPTGTWTGNDGWAAQLQTHDLLYPIFLQTNLAKYISAHGDSEHSVFQPEVAYTPKQMKDNYMDAINKKFQRFLQSEGGTTEGASGETRAMDNIATWMNAADRARIINTAVANFKQAIQNFQDWATGRSSPEERWTIDGDTISFRDGANGERRVYYGGFVSSDGSDWAPSSFGWDPVTGEAESWYTDRNTEAFKSAKKFFGEEGNPISANCTLEFGYDRPQNLDGTWDCLPALGGIYGAIGYDDAIYMDSSNKFNQYKCYTQKEGFINVAGYESTDETDSDNMIYGKFLKVQDHETAPSAWGLNSATIISERIRAHIESDPMLSDDGVQSIFLIVQTFFDGLRSEWLNSSDDNEGYFQSLITNEFAWNALAAEKDLLNPDGSIKEEMLSDYARELREGMDDRVQSWLTMLGSGFYVTNPETEGYISTRAKNYRLRWCPDILSPMNTYDPSRNIGTDPYGGSWDYLATSRSRRNSLGALWDDDDGEWFMQGGCGTGGGGGGGGAAQRTGTNAAVGRHEVSPVMEILQPVIDRWENTWRFAAADAIKDAVRLVAEYHGFNTSKGDLKLLSRTDIVVEKYGWFFFDLEKYIQKFSVLSRYVNPGHFQKYFEWGRDMLNYTVRIDEVMFNRCPTNVPSDDDKKWTGTTTAYGKTGPHVEMTLKYNSSLEAQPTSIDRLKFLGTCGGGGSTAAGNAAYAKIRQLDVASWSDLAVYRGDDGVYLADRASRDPISSYQQYSYLMQRNYDFAYNESVPDDYRMACFAYNYYIDDEAAMAGPDSVAAKVIVRDRSGEILNKYVTYVEDILSDFESYVLMAEENCAYNSFDSQFNQFFIEKMDELYGDNPSSAPWLRAAATYTLYEDLFFGTYGGEFSIVLENASAQADNINPYTGTLTLLQEFKVLLDAMLTFAREKQAEYLAGIEDGSIDEYYEFSIGSAATAEGYIPGWASAIDIFIDKPIIDYAYDDSQAPPVPESTFNSELDPVDIDTEYSGPRDPWAMVGDIDAAGTAWRAAATEGLSSEVKGYFGEPGWVSGVTTGEAPSKEADTTGVIYTTPDRPGTEDD